MQRKDDIPFPRILAKILLLSIYFKPNSSYAHTVMLSKVSDAKKKRKKSNVLAKDVFIFSVQCFSHGFRAFIIQTSKRNARLLAFANRFFFPTYSTYVLGSIMFFFYFCAGASDFRNVLCDLCTRACICSCFANMPKCHIYTQRKIAFSVSVTTVLVDGNIIAAAVARYLVFSFWLFTYTQTQIYADMIVCRRRRRLSSHSLKFLS